jgi:hypothetical protein
MAKDYSNKNVVKLKTYLNTVKNDDKGSKKSTK